MDNERLMALVDELDRLVPRDGAVIWEDHGLYGSEHGPGFLGNRLGYLRFGIELLRIADAPHQPDNPTRVVADLSYLVNIERQQGEVAIFERRDIKDSELVAARQPPSRVSRALQMAGCLVVVVVILLAIILGLGVIIRWIARTVAA